MLRHPVRNEHVFKECVENQWNAVKTMSDEHTLFWEFKMNDK